MEDYLNYLKQKLIELPPVLILILVIPISVSIYVVYQLYFHPLAKYPGPLLAKFSIVRAGYHSWKGDGHIDIWRQHNKYGPIVRYGPSWLLFNSVEGYRDIYGAKSNTAKHHQFSQFNPRAANLFTIYNKNEHSQRRRCIGKAFSDANMVSFEGRLIGHVKHFCDQIDSSHKRNGSEWSEPLRMSEWVGYLVFDTLTDFLLGQGYNLLASTSHRPITHHIKNHIVRPAVCSYIPLLAVLKIDKLLFKEAARSTRALWRWVKCAIANRSKQVGYHQTDVFDRIQLSRQSEQYPTAGIESETGMFIVAGFDTTTTALCALLFYLSRNRAAYERLCIEIRNTFDHEDQIRLGQRLKSCTFLHACIDEALRMSPPIGSPPWREVGSGGEIIAGLAIPQGCSVGTGVYSMHHNDKYFETPHEFMPDRWLNDSHSKGSGGKACNPAFMPFSSGPRSCIGRSLARAEVSLTAAILLWQYDLRASPGTCHGLGGGKAVRRKEKVARENPGEFQLVDRVVGHPEGPVIEFRRRPKFNA